MYGMWSATKAPARLAIKVKIVSTGIETTAGKEIVVIPTRLSF